MPYKSLAQERYFNANRTKLEKQGVSVDEWNKSSKGLKLPPKVDRIKSYVKHISNNEQKPKKKS